MSKNGLLIILTGLPGCGKSTLAKIIRDYLHQYPVKILDGDRINRQLHPKPTYTRDELVSLHKHIHEKAFEYLSAGEIVIYDATNILDRYRDSACQLAAQAGASFILVEVKADEELIRERLETRSVDENNYSDANFSVYRRMKMQYEPVQQEHIELYSTEQGFTNLDILKRTLVGLLHFPSSNDPKPVYTRNQSSGVQ